MQRMRILLAVSWLLTGSVAVAAQDSKWEWEGVSRVVALGDVHGSYDKMVTLLKGTGLIDDDLKWIGGDQHLVFCGDLTDRGSNDRHVMDLAKRLQQEAEAAGGRVHVVLGNHEIMNLTRDRRYWDADLLDEFADDETSGERKQALGRYRAAQRMQAASEGRAFDDEFPPGYFARSKAFDADGEYGAWLLEQPTVVKVNGVLFLHGGLTPRVAGLGLDEINRQVTESIKSFLESADTMGDAVPFPGDMSATIQAAYTLADRGGRTPKAQAAKTLLEVQDEGLGFDPAGPVWYRGTSVETERIEAQNVAAVLDHLGARAQMMGHTVTRTGKISSRFNGTVYRADVGMGYGRKPLAAVIVDETLQVYDPARNAMTAAYIEPLQGEGWPAGEEDLAPHVLETFLRKASIKSMSDIEFEGIEGKLLDLERKDMALRAVYGAMKETADEAAAAGRTGRRRYQHQVAAYRLDRMLGFGLVPVTVLRKVDGSEGMVQIWMQGALDAQQFEEYDDYSLIEGLDEEIAQAQAFTVLIGLEGADRLAVGEMVLPASRRVMTADNAAGFSTDPGVDRYLPLGCGPVGAAFLHDLEMLDRASLRKELGKLLTGAQIDALLERRDGLLQACVTRDPEWSLERFIERRRARSGS